MMTINDPWDRVYKTTQAHNYEKREEAFITSITKEEALKNAHQLIESEEMAKLKVERKKAKEKRQKKRKKAEKTNNGNEEKKTTSNSATNLDSNVATKTNKTKNDEESEDEGPKCFDQEKHIDDEFLDINAAFVKFSVKQNKNIASNKVSVPKPEKVNPRLDSISTPMPKFMKPKITKSQSDTAETLGMRSCDLVLNNDFHTAIDFLSQAIFHAPEDVRHYLNRSYCYLRLGQYTLALNDAQFAKERSQLTEHFAKAVAREGQALYGLRQYHEAEMCFEKILEFEERNEWILTELIRARASQLTDMGFSNIDALNALQQCKAVVDAVTLLTSGDISSPELKSNINMSEIESCDGDEIYFSDDESSSTILLSKLVLARANESCYLDDHRSQPSSSKTQLYSNSLERTLKSNVSMESLHSNEIKSHIEWEVMPKFKSIPRTSKTQIQKPIVSDSSSIWVGSIDKNVTEHKLRELFGVFGKINHIRRFDDERNYVFINFNSKKAATKALNNTSDFEINGIKLPVKPAH